MQADENLKVELAADVQEECAKLGAVESVKVSSLPLVSGYKYHKFLD